MEDELALLFSRFYGPCREPFLPQTQVLQIAREVREARIHARRFGTRERLAQVGEGVVQLDAAQQETAGPPLEHAAHRGLTAPERFAKKEIFVQLGIARRIPHQVSRDMPGEP